MNGAISIVHGIVSGNSRPSSGSFQKEAPAGFGAILAGVQEKPISLTVDSTQNDHSQNMDEEALQMLNEMAMNTLTKMEEAEAAGDTNEASVNDFIYGLMNQLPALSPENIKLLEDAISQVKQFIQNPLSIDSANLLDGDQLQRLADIEQLTDNVEMKPAFAVTYALLKELGKMVPNAQEQLKQYQQEANGKTMPSLKQVAELVKTLEGQLESLNSRNSLAGTQKVLVKTYPFMNILNGGKFSSQPVMNGQTLLNKGNGAIQAGLTENQLTKPIKGSTELIASSETANLAGALPMSKVEQFVLHLGQTNGKTDSAKLYQEFQQILAKSSLVQNANNSKLTIRLAPEHLGSLQIELIKQDQVMIAKMVASTQQAKELLESQLSSLKQAFVNAHIQVEKIDIQQQFQPFDRFMNQSDQQQNQSNQHSRQNPKDEGNEDKEEPNSFFASLEEELLNINV